MSIVKRNIIANLTGSIWLALMSFIFIPLYIKYLGVAAWGLIGIFATLQVVFGLLDMGLSTTLNRQMAMLSQVKESGQAMRDLLKTLEYVYWAMAALVAVSLLFLAPLITKYWINSTQLPPETIEQSLMLMGIVIALQLPVGLYSGGLMGLQRQVLLNGVNIVVGTFRGLGVVLVLWLVSPTIHAFFIWQIITSAINVLLLVIFLWKKLPPTAKKASFKMAQIKGIWRFAAGMSGISVLAIILAQLDKIVLSKLISLESFGYYMVANTVAMSIGRFISPIFYSIYPRFTQLVANDSQEELKILYHKVAQLISVIILPIAIVLVFFSYDVLFLWTKNALLAQNAYIIVSILICGSAINAIMHPPYALQLAAGWTRLSFFKNIIAIIIIVPLIIYLAKQYGPTGAACAWLILNVGYLLFEIAIMHLRLLKNEKVKWYVQDLLVPLVVGLVPTLLVKYSIGNRHFSPLMTMIFLGTTLTITMGMTAVATPATREILFETVAKLRLKKVITL